MKDLKMLETSLTNAPRQHKLAVYEVWVTELREDLEKIVEEYHPSRGEVRLAKAILGLGEL